jgi:hypothetical protein
MGETNNSDILLARLADGLDSTAKMTQALLSDLRESEADFASVKTELNILKENVKGLSQIIRDGDGTSSILTRVALIEQNIENVKKWMDNHIDVHQIHKKDISDTRNYVIEIDKRLKAVEDIIKEIKDKEFEAEKFRKATIDRELDLSHERRKLNEKVKADRKEALTKIIAAIMLGLIGALGGYVANSCTSGSKNTGNAGAQTTTIPANPLPSIQQQTPPSLTSSQTK